MPAAKDQWKEEKLLELSQGEPKVYPAWPLDGGNVDEERPAVDELDIVGGPILEGPATLQKLHLQVERLKGGIGQHRDGPLIRIGYVRY